MGRNEELWGTYTVVKGEFNTANDGVEVLLVCRKNGYIMNAKKKKKTLKSIGNEAGKTHWGYIMREGKLELN